MECRYILSMAKSMLRLQCSWWNFRFLHTCLLLLRTCGWERNSGWNLGIHTILSNIVVSAVWRLRFDSGWEECPPRPNFMICTQNGFSQRKAVTHQRLSRCPLTSCALVQRRFATRYETTSWYGRDTAWATAEPCGDPNKATAWRNCQMLRNRI